MKTRDEIIDWLRDAYAMERALEIGLKKQMENDALSAAIRTQARRHLEETRAHAAAVKACLEGMGTDCSALKTGVATTLEAMRGIGTMFTADERVKDLLSAYASEHFEIACYQALRTAADWINETTVIALCDRIIPDEERMAEWLRANLPGVVQSYMVETAVCT